MKTNTVKRVNVSLPSETLSKIDRIAERGDRSRFIDRAVNFYVREIGKQSLRDALKERAQKHATRDRALAEEWFFLEEEAWQRNGQK